MLAFVSAVAIFALAGLHDVGGLISYSAVRVAHQKVSTAYDESKWTPASAAVGSDHGKKAWTITNDTSGAPLPPVSDDQRFPSDCVLPGAMDLDTNSTYHAWCPADAASFMSGADCPGFSAASPAIQVPVQDAAAVPTAAAQLYSQALLDDAEVLACDRGFTGDDYPALLVDADRISTSWDNHSSQLSAVHSAVASLAPATETTDEVDNITFTFRGPHVAGSSYQMLLEDSIRISTGDDYSFQHSGVNYETHGFLFDAASCLALEYQFVYNDFGMSMPDSSGSNSSIVTQTVADHERVVTFDFERETDCPDREPGSNAGSDTLLVEFLGSKLRPMFKFTRTRSSKPLFYSVQRIRAFTLKKINGVYVKLRTLRRCNSNLRFQPNNQRVLRKRNLRP